MTPTEVQRLVRQFAGASGPTPGEISEELFEVWHGLLEDVPAAAAKTAALNLLARQPGSWRLTPGEVRREAARVLGLLAPSYADAAELLTNCECRYSAVLELPIVVQRALRQTAESSAAVWRGLDDRERAEFRRTYEAIARQHDEIVLNVGGVRHATEEKAIAADRASAHRASIGLVAVEPMPVLTDEEMAENRRKLNALLDGLFSDRCDSVRSS